MGVNEPRHEEGALAVDARDWLPKASGQGAEIIEGAGGDDASFVNQKGGKALLLHRGAGVRGASRGGPAVHVVQQGGIGHRSAGEAREVKGKGCPEESEGHGTPTYFEIRVLRSVPGSARASAVTGAFWATSWRAAINSRGLFTASTAMSWPSFR